MTSALDISALYAEHSSFLARNIERMVGYDAAAEDILQETFIVAYQKQQLYDPQQAKISTWLYGIAFNLCRRHLRGRGRFQRFQIKLSQASSFVEDSPQAKVERDEITTWIHQCLQKLPLRQREVVTLYELEELSGPEIANILDIPEGTVWTRLHHGRKSFKKHLERKLKEGGSPWQN